MSGFQPLIIVNGQQEQAADRRVEILRLNIGPAEPIAVTSALFTITRSCHRPTNTTTSNIDVVGILGGLEGDVVVFFSGINSKKLKLKQGPLLDIVGDFEFKDNHSITLYRNATGWEEICRSQ